MCGGCCHERHRCGKTCHILLQKEHARDVGDSSVIFVEAKAAFHRHEIGKRYLRAPVGFPLREKIIAGKRHPPFRDAHTDKGRHDGFRHGPAEKRCLCAKTRTIAFCNQFSIVHDHDCPYAGAGKRQFFDQLLNGWINCNIDGLRLDLRYRPMGGPQILAMNIGAAKAGAISGAAWREEA